jgi:hypothetical protein
VDSFEKEIKMRKILWIILCLALVGCRTSHSLPVSTPRHQTPDTTTIPTFPAEALYVLGAQWEADSLLQQKQNIAEYIEQELIRIYPEKAYKGYINRLCTITDRLLENSKQRPTLFAPQREEISFASTSTGTLPQSIEQQSTGATNLYLYLDSLTLAEEIQIMAFTPQEQADWETLQSLVHSPKPLTREAFDTLNITGFEEENVLLTMLLWRGPRIFYRVLQSKARAEKLAYYYYGDATNNGRPGDAFKHIYVNVLLRTYVGDWLSYAIMDVFWEWKAPNAPCDHFMDLHNNIIGRQTRYQEFSHIDAQCSDTRYWLQWAENVQHFVQDSVNGHRQSWDKETPTFIVEPAAKQVSSKQYIYWDK